MILRLYYNQHKYKIKTIIIFLLHYSMRTEGEHVIIVMKITPADQRIFFMSSLRRDFLCFSSSAEVEESKRRRQQRGLFSRMPSKPLPKGECVVLSGCPLVLQLMAVDEMNLISV